MSTLPVTSGGLFELQAVPVSRPRVANLRHEELGDAVYVGRASPSRGLTGSAFANPYRIGQDGDRAEVIELYRDWLLGRPELLGRLRELRGRRLACWCRPLPCHADVLAELVDADELLDELKAAGVAVEAHGDRLRLSPASKVDAALQARVAAHKAATLSLLARTARDREAAKAFYRRLVATVAETVRVPADCLPDRGGDWGTPEEARVRPAGVTALPPAVAIPAGCGPLQHEPEPVGRDARGWTRYVCRKCGRFYGYAPGSPAALQSRLERT